MAAEFRYMCGSLFLSTPSEQDPNFKAPSMRAFSLPLQQPSRCRTFEFPSKIMSGDEREQQNPASVIWSGELKLPELLLKSETVRSLHATIDHEWGPLQRSACQTAAGRALWNHVVHDPVADVLAGESFLRSFYEKMKKDRINNAREASGVILAVRTLWFDSRIEAAINSFEDEEAQVVILGAGMDARAYRLSCLKKSSIFEVDFPELLQTKATLVKEAMGSTGQQQIAMKAKSLTRVAADIREGDWLEKLQRCGFFPERNTVWVLEGIIYYLPHHQAMQVLKSIAANCAVTRSVLLADFMNKSSVSLSHSTFLFYSDWPDHLLPSLGFSHVKLSQIGDPDAHFGLLHDPQNLFNKLRGLHRSIETDPEDGTPCRRLYLVEASGFPPPSHQRALLRSPGQNSEYSSCWSTPEPSSELPSCFCHQETAWRASSSDSIFRSATPSTPMRIKLEIRKQKGVRTEKDKRPRRGGDGVQ